MDIQALYAALRQYEDVMALNAPAVLAALAAFEEAQCLKLPPALRELLACFNGGEIFIPGTTIYGTDQEGAYSQTRSLTAGIAWRPGWMRPFRTTTRILRSSYEHIDDDERGKAAAHKCAAKCRA